MARRICGGGAGSLVCGKPAGEEKRAPALQPLWFCVSGPLVWLLLRCWHLGHVGSTSSTHKCVYSARVSFGLRGSVHVRCLRMLVAALMLGSRVFKCFIDELSSGCSVAVDWLVLNEIRTECCLKTSANAQMQLPV